MMCLPIQGLKVLPSRLLRTLDSKNVLEILAQAVHLSSSDARSKISRLRYLQPLRPLPRARHPAPSPPRDARQLGLMIPAFRSLRPEPYPQ